MGVDALLSNRLYLIDTHSIIATYFLHEHNSKNIRICYHHIDFGCFIMDIGTVKDRREHRTTDQK